MRDTPISLLKFLYVILRQWEVNSRILRNILLILWSLLIAREFNFWNLGLEGLRVLVSIIWAVYLENLLKICNCLCLSYLSKVIMFQNCLIMLNPRLFPLSKGPLYKPLVNCAIKVSKKCWKQQLITPEFYKNLKILSVLCLICW